MPPLDGDVDGVNDPPLPVELVVDVWLLVLLVRKRIGPAKRLAPDDAGGPETSRFNVIGEVDITTGLPPLVSKKSSASIPGWKPNGPL